MLNRYLAVPNRQEHGLWRVLRSPKANAIEHATGVLLQNKTPDVSSGVLKMLCFFGNCFLWIIAGVFLGLQNFKTLNFCNANI
jgi:hypothetical protein